MIRRTLLGAPNFVFEKLRQFGDASRIIEKVSTVVVDVPAVVHPNEAPSGWQGVEQVCHRFPSPTERGSGDPIPPAALGISGLKTAAVSVSTQTRLKSAMTLGQCGSNY